MIDPNGKLIASPLHTKEGILFTEIDYCLCYEGLNGIWILQDTMRELNVLELLHR